MGARGSSFQTERGSSYSWWQRGVKGTLSAVFPSAPATSLRLKHFPLIPYECQLTLNGAGSILSTLKIASYLIKMTLWENNWYYPHFSAEKTEIWLSFSPDLIAVSGAHWELVLASLTSEPTSLTTLLSCLPASLSPTFLTPWSLGTPAYSSCLAPLYTSRGTPGLQSTSSQEGGGGTCLWISKCFLIHFPVWAFQTAQ